MDYDFTFKKEELNKCYNCRKDLDNVEIFLYKDKKYCVRCSPWIRFNSSFLFFLNYKFGIYSNIHFLSYGAQDTQIS